MIEEDNFMQAKTKYRDARDEGRRKIINTLKKKGFKVKTKGPAGHGLPGYTSKKQIKVYDLRNWMWVDASRQDVQVVVYMQSFDQDPGSKNFHVLFDRLSISVMRGAEEINKLTEFDLPLSMEDLNVLVEEIECIISSLEN